MIITISEVDCADWYKDGSEKNQPTQMLLASLDEHTNGDLFPDPWYTVASPVGGEESEYSCTGAGSAMVRVPLFSYNAPTQRKDVLFAAGVQAGLFALANLPQRGNVSRMHMAYGLVAELPDPNTGEPMHQAWLGLAFQLIQ